MEKQITTPKKINILGHLLTGCSLIFFILILISALVSLPKQYEAYNEITGVPEQVGAIIGMLVGTGLIFYTILQYIKIHNRFKLYISGQISRKKFTFYYIFLWIATVLFVFIPAFSKSIPVILIFVLVMLLPILYLTSIHKYVKIDGDKKI